MPMHSAYVLFQGVSLSVCEDLVSYQNGLMYRQNSFTTLYSRHSSFLWTKPRSKILWDHLWWGLKIHMGGLCKICNFWPRNRCFSEIVQYRATVTYNCCSVLTAFPLCRKSGNFVLTGMSVNFAVWQGTFCSQMLFAIWTDNKCNDYRIYSRMSRKIYDKLLS